ncbi:hypothetical protein NSE_0079 [Neorickettsia sennetsu str. Miyayama]|uniref:Uncharacterized protein n=1 Tax=Ehrlichia sennetsu (strain ATCC VR-367 / Miyayama) TaxID=222891 RepID=Q2GEW6_EHRS3|nr:hypothetical protein NSE_0079 [Neorickettsia sennetsu str. Miyayama]
MGARQSILPGTTLVGLIRLHHLVGRRADFQTTSAVEYVGRLLYITRTGVVV